MSTEVVFIKTTPEERQRIFDVILEVHAALKQRASNDQDKDIAFYDLIDWIGDLEFDYETGDIAMPYYG